MCAAIPALDFPIIRHVQRVYTQLARTRKYLGIGYDTPEGHYEFRQQIARRGTDAGIHLSPEAIVTTGGAQNALALGLRVLTSPGDIVAVESPCYYGLLQMIEYFGLKAIEVPSHPTTGMSLEALHLALKQWPIKAILTVSNFSNPLGSTIPDDNKRAIAELLETYDVALLEDDVYGELFFGEVRPKTIKSFDQAGRVLYCSSLSKTIDPQLRVGWIAPGRYYKDVSHRKFINSIASPTLPQMVAAEVMAQGIYERHLRHARSVYRQRYQRMLDLVHESFPLETRVSRPEGGLVAWFECPGRVDTTVLYHQLHNEGVTVAPGEIFSLSGQYRNCFRVNYAQEWTPEREAALRQVGHLLKKAIG